VPASHSGQWFSSEEYAKDHASKAGPTAFTCLEWCVGSVFSLNTALTLRLSSSKVFSNVGNLGRHKKKFHHGSYYFSVSFDSTDIIHQPSRTTKTGPRQDAQLLCENTAALVLTNSLAYPSLLR